MAPSQDHLWHLVKCSGRDFLQKKLVQGHLIRNRLSICWRPPIRWVVIWCPRPKMTPRTALPVCLLKPVKGLDLWMPPYCASYTPVVGNYWSIVGKIISFPPPRANYREHHLGNAVHTCAAHLHPAFPDRPGGRQQVHSGDSWQASLWEWNILALHKFLTRFQIAAVSLLSALSTSEREGKNRLIKSTVRKCYW